MATFDVKQNHHPWVALLNLSVRAQKTLVVEVVRALEFELPILVCVRVRSSIFM